MSLKPLVLAVWLHMALVAGRSTVIKPTRTKELTLSNLSVLEAHEFCDEVTYMSPHKQQCMAVHMHSNALS